jgi:hypothetical protein
MRELDQNSEILFVKRNDTNYIYLVAKLPDGQRVASELPTAIQKEKS